MLQRVTTADVVCNQSPGHISSEILISADRAIWCSYTLSVLAQPYCKVYFVLFRQSCFSGKVAFPANMTDYRSTTSLDLFNVDVLTLLFGIVRIRSSSYDAEN